MHTRRGLAGAALALVSLALIPGCGGQGGGATVPSADTVGGRGGVLRYAIARDPENLDPLTAPAQGRLVSRQIYEPLVDRLSPPLGQGLSRRGLVVGWDASRDKQVWRLRLRRHVAFQDGQPFDAGAVAVNATRWQTTAAGRRLLPRLRTVDAPRQTVARFVFSRSVSNLPKLLASPRLGVVSPAALSSRDGRGAQVVRNANAGTGPFELREWHRGGNLTLARSAGWWGTRYGLGPALDQVAFTVVPPEAERVRLLGVGSVQVASDLSARSRREIRQDPLLSTISAPGGGLIGLERSVRGLSGSPAESLSQVWLTQVAG